MSIVETPTPPPVQPADGPRPVTAPLLGKPAIRLLLLLLLLGGVLIIRESELLANGTLSDRLQTFVTIFLSIFIEAAPFLLAGSIVSGLLEVYVDKDMIYRFIPRNPVTAALMGGALGIIFPVCECGVVPVTRRLYQKGLPVSMGIAFMLAAPVVNPVVIASTYAAFGWSSILLGRLLFTFLIASFIGLLFYFAKPKDIFLPEQERAFNEGQHHDHDHEHSEHSEHCEHCQHDHAPAPSGSRFWEAMGLAGDDFVDMARYLIVGSMLAAAMQTLVPQPVLLALGDGAITSIVAMMVLAFVLSVCSTVDAFLALAFVNSFPPAAILAFLVFGPMVDIKSALMFLGVFNRRTVLYLILLPLMATLALAVYLNLNVRW